MAKSNYYWNYNGSLYCSYGNVKNGGKTESVIESPDGQKKSYEISIRRDTYSIKEKGN